MVSFYRLLYANTDYYCQEKVKKTFSVEMKKEKKHETKKKLICWNWMTMSASPGKYRKRVKQAVAD